LLGDIVHEPCLHYLFSAAGLRAALDAPRLVVMARESLYSGKYRKLMLSLRLSLIPELVFRRQFLLYSDQKHASGGKHYSLFPTIESATPHIHALTRVFHWGNSASYTLHARVIAELPIIKVCYYVDSRFLIHRP
jgi:hypothetical protein